MYGQEQAAQAQAYFTLPQLPATIDNVPVWEWAGVAVVGAALGFAARTIGLQGVLGGSLLYILGYWVRGRRPAAGWRYLPSPVFAAFPQQAMPTRDQVV